MGKAPAFQFYVKDWLSDPQLQCVRPSTRGLWIDLLCYMWQSPTRGKLTVQEDDLVRLLRCNNGDLSTFMEDAERYEFVTITKANKEITLINRRMFREYNDKENNRIRQQRFREKKESNANITPLSPSPSPSAKNKDILSSKLDPIPFSEIISYLNQKTNKNFSSKAKTTQKLIRARWNEGRRLEDFQKVIDIKCEKWLTDEKMVDYLRPETLFNGTKMESYLQEELYGSGDGDVLERIRKAKERDIEAGRIVESSTETPDGD